MRIAFPVIDRFPSVYIDDLVAQGMLGQRPAYFWGYKVGTELSQARLVDYEQLAGDILGSLPPLEHLFPMERLVALKVLEYGLVGPAELSHALRTKPAKESFAQHLLRMGLVTWEPLLGACLDMRVVSRLDPLYNNPQSLRREWELSGEIMIAMGKLRRTDLERALKVKRDGSQAIGEILAAMGACSRHEIERCLMQQSHQREEQAKHIALIGQLMVERGVVSAEDLEEVLRSQKIARKPLGELLATMGACSMRDVATAEANARRPDGFIDDNKVADVLVQMGAVEPFRVEEARRVQSRGRQMLGELILQLRLCSPEDLQAVLKLQRDIRKEYHASGDRLGDILVKNRIVAPQTVEEAAAMQKVGRQRLGAILVALGMCSASDFEVAIEVQQHWRERCKRLDDRLGDVLVRKGLLTPEQLTEVLDEHNASKNPVGRVIVEGELLKPEVVIDVLMERDQMRRERFLAFITDWLNTDISGATREMDALRPGMDSRRRGRNGSGEQASQSRISFMEKLSAWISKRLQR